MSNNELVEKVLEIQSKFKLKSDNLNSYIKRHFNELYLEIEKQTVELNKFKKFKFGTTKLLDISIFERLYCIKHNLSDRPKCRVCGKNYVNGFNLQLNEYKKWCCPSCQASDQECLEKVKKTKLEKYGNLNNNQQATKTRIAKYGSYHKDDFGQKVKKTKLEHYGNETFVNIEKIKQTKLERYGSENYNNTEKNKETKLKRYNDEFYNNREKFKETILLFDESKKSKIKEKRKETNINKYGIEFPTQNKLIKEKIAETTLKRYGYSTYFISDINREHLKLNIRNSVYENILKNKNIVLLTSKEEFLKIPNLNDDNAISIKCQKCSLIYNSYWDNGHCIPCPNCFPKLNGTSNQEKEIINFIKDNYFENIDTNSKKIISPLELDIYIPKNKLAIEFDGLFWHSDNFENNKNYHLNKTELCEKLGIQLIHIFENEWLTKQDIVKSRLKNLLGIYDKTVYARCCEIKPVASGESKDFQDKNHIQGLVNAGVSLGLYFDNELISLMTFGKCRFNKNYEYELLRFCNKLGYHIPGAASKLLKYFERNYNPKSLISYADRRWSKGNVYEKLGFKLDHKSGPNYWYWRDRYILESRIKYQKHKLKNVLEKFDETKSEMENMKANGYNRIFDCGNLVYVKEY